MQNNGAPYPPFPPPAPAPVGDHVFPRRIFTFWDSYAYPELVAACFASFRILNPGWEITVLHDHDPLLPEPPTPQTGPRLTAQQKADWYRIAALAEYGGVWMDSTNIGVQSMDHWVNTSALMLQGFNMPASAMYDPTETIMENWAFASPSNCTFTQRWRDCFHEALQTGAEIFVRAQNRTVLGSMYGNAYLAEHACWLLTREALPDEPYSLLPSTDYGRPFYYQMEYMHDGNFDSARATFAVLSRAPPDGTAFVKLRGSERGCVGPLWMYGASGLGGQLRSWLESQPDLLANSTVPQGSSCFVAGYIWWHTWWIALLTLLLLLCCIGGIISCYYKEELRGALHRRGWCLWWGDSRAREEATRLRDGPRGEALVSS